MGLFLKLLSVSQFKTPSMGVLFLGVALLLAATVQPAKSIIVWSAQDRYQLVNVEQKAKIQSVKPLAPYARNSNYRLFVGEDHFHDFQITGDFRFQEYRKTGMKLHPSSRPSSRDSCLELRNTLSLGRWGVPQIFFLILFFLFKRACCRMFMDPIFCFPLGMTIDY